MKPSTSPPAAPHSFTLIELVIIVATLMVLFCFLIPSMVREKRRRPCQNNLRQIGLAFKTWALDSDDLFPMQVSVEPGGTTGLASAGRVYFANVQRGTKELMGSGRVYIHFRAISNELGTPKILVCPMDKSKKTAQQFDVGFSDTNVSYFVGADAVDIVPQAFLSGDRNLAVSGVPLRPGLFVLTTNMSLGWTKAIHGSCGNILLADGSVQFLNSIKLATAAAQQGLATNRLAIP
jgi:hypothetical protein